MSPHVDLMNVLLVCKPWQMIGQDPAPKDRLGRRSTRIKREHFMSHLATQHFMSDLLPEEAQPVTISYLTGLGPT